MRQFLFFMSAIILYSCNNPGNDFSNEQNTYQPPENSKVVKVQLIDSLGDVILSIPRHYDTSFSWIHVSDCGKPCDKKKYRFQPKINAAIEESGFYWTEPGDSTERFTISHSMEFPFHKGDTGKNLNRHKYAVQRLISGSKHKKIAFDTIQKINDRYFSIIVIKKADSIQSIKVLAMTTIKNNEINFLYELLTNKNDSISKNFIETSIDLIKTIRISKGI